MKYTEEPILAYARSRIRFPDQQKGKRSILGLLGIGVIVMFICLIKLISEGDLKWADAIFVMERLHQKWIQGNFRHLKLPPLVILDIPDDLVFMDPELQRLLRLAIDPEIGLLLST